MIGEIKMIDPIPYLRECRKHWQWLADNPNLHKADYFFTATDKKTPYSLCYVCQYVRDAFGQHNMRLGLCRSFCPIKWAYPHGTCNNALSPYFLWKIAYQQKDFEASRKYALQIVRLTNEAIEREKEKGIKKC